MGGKSKIGDNQIKFLFFFEKDVLRFDVSMYNIFLMKFDECLKKLFHDKFNILFLHFLVIESNSIEKGSSTT